MRDTLNPIAQDCPAQQSRVRPAGTTGRYRLKAGPPPIEGRAATD